MSTKGIGVKKLKLSALFASAPAPAPAPAPGANDITSPVGRSDSSNSSHGNSSAGGGGGGGGESARVDQAVSSRSAPGTVRDVPTCPACRDASGNYVRKLRYWTGGNTWVWHCSAEPQSRDGTGSSFCGLFFTEDRPRAVCRDCGGSVRLLMVGGESQGDFYYYCSKCKLKDH